MVFRTLFLGFVCLLVQCLHIFLLCEFTFVIRAALLLKHDGSRRRHSILFDLLCCNVFDCFRVFVFKVLYESTRRYPG